MSRMLFTRMVVRRFPVHMWADFPFWYSAGGPRVAHMTKMLLELKQHIAQTLPYWNRTLVGGCWGGGGQHAQRCSTQASDSAILHAARWLAGPRPHLAGDA